MKFMNTNLPPSHWDEQLKSLFGLFLTATPIGNLEDITLRALVTLRGVDGILCEDTRTTSVLLHHYQIATPCYSYHRHNETRKLQGILHRLQQGDKLVLVSDRGMPLISDPGFLLVAACYEAHIPVHIIPGASAALAAVVLSGFPCSSFFFQGFLPPTRNRKILTLLASLPVPIVFFEAPHRIPKFLARLQEIFGDRKVCLLRELTKKFEERIFGSLSQIQQRIPPILGECVIVVQGASAIAEKHPLHMMAMDHKFHNR